MYANDMPTCRLSTREMWRKYCMLQRPYELLQVLLGRLIQIFNLFSQCLSGEKMSSIGLSVELQDCIETVYPGLSQHFTVVVTVGTQLPDLDDVTHEETRRYESGGDDEVPNMKELTVCETSDISDLEVKYQVCERSKRENGIVMCTRR